MKTIKIFATSAAALIFSATGRAVLVGDFENSFTTGSYTWNVADGSYTAFDSFFVSSGATSIELWTARDPFAPQDANFASDLGLLNSDFPVNSFAGSAIYQDFSITSLTTLSFDFQFDTFESESLVNAGWNDYGFVSIVDSDTGTVLEVDRFVDSLSVFSGGGQGLYNRLLGPGNYRIGIGSMNLLDYQVDSILAVDNVNLTASVDDNGSALFLSALAFVSLASLRRSKRNV